MDEHTGEDERHRLVMNLQSGEGTVAEDGASPSRDQLVALVQSIMNVEGSEEEHHAKLVYLRASVSDPNVVDYIYWPPDGKEMSAAEVVDRALSYKPIEL